MTPPNDTPALDQMTSTAQEILREIGSMPPACVPWKPAAEVWSVMDILCHIAEFVPYWTSQIEVIVATPEKSWGRTHNDPDRLAAVAETSSRELDDVLHALSFAVSASVEKLRGFSTAQLATEALSRNPRWGLKPASFVLDELLVKHLKTHLAQVRRNVSQFQHMYSGQHPQEKPLETDIVP